MPEIARFYGIVIKMFFSEHNPPHFHAVYGEYNGTFDLKTLEMTEGDLPVKAKSLIKEWAAQYQSELLKMWNEQNITKLPPLE